MAYLEMVIDETQRMFPPVTRIDRVCNHDYEFENIKLAKGQLWIASVNALHYDEELYPNPQQFDPERFNSVNKIKREVHILLINQIIIISKIFKKNVTQIMKILSCLCAILNKLICHKI